MKSLLRDLLQVAYLAVLYATPACAALIFISMSAACVGAVHVQAGDIR